MFVTEGRQYEAYYSRRWWYCLAWATWSHFNDGETQLPYHGVSIIGWVHDLRCSAALLSRQFCDQAKLMSMTSQ